MLNAYIYFFIYQFYIDSHGLIRKILKSFQFRKFLEAFDLGFQCYNIYKRISKVVISLPVPDFVKRTNSIIVTKLVTRFSWTLRLHKTIFRRFKARTKYWYLHSTSESDSSMSISHVSIEHKIQRQTNNKAIL